MFGYISANRLRLNGQRDVTGALCVSAGRGRNLEWTIERLPVGSYWFAEPELKQVKGHWEMTCPRCKTILTRPFLKPQESEDKPDEWKCHECNWPGPDKQ